ncbi:MAG: hypothetical protein H0U45_17310 [Tatlockia sp.]|nr:hypothetical protein [Tatlockia sp.]
MSLMAQVDRARSTLQAANEQLSEARGLLGKPKQEAPKEPEEKGLFDKFKDTVSNVSLSDVGHTVLDLAGLVPVLGAPADGINAVWYAAEGDWVNAGLSATGMIPIAGEAATAAKLGIRATDAVRGADDAVDAARAADNATGNAVREGIYEFPATSGKPYVGQSGNIDGRLEQHIRSGKLAPEELPNVERTEVLGGKTNREVAEQRRIDELGGIENLDNKINPIGPKRRHLLGEW